MPASHATLFEHYVFIDFENVPLVRLELPDDASAKVVLLIGEKQRKMELELVQQIHRHAARVQLIEVGAAGRNALDLTLAYHLGQIAARAPEAKLYVISKDKDFDPLIGHLRREGRQAVRHEDFHSLPFLAPRIAEPETDERLAKLIAQLKHKVTARPARKKTLLAHIDTFFGKQLPPDEIEALVADLEQRSVVHIDAAGRVTYTA